MPENRDSLGRTYSVSMWLTGVSGGLRQWRSCADPHPAPGSGFRLQPTFLTPTELQLQLMFGNTVLNGNGENTDDVQEWLPAENAAMESNEELLPELSHQD